MFGSKSMAQLHPHRSKSASQLQAPGRWHHVFLSGQETIRIFSSLCTLGLIKVVCFMCQQLSPPPKIIGKEMNYCGGIWMGKLNTNSPVLHILTRCTMCICSFLRPEGSVVLINPDYRHCTGRSWSLMFCISFSSQLLCWHRLIMCNYYT